MTELAATRSFVLERKMPHPLEQIWRALTQGPLIEEWLMKNDFQPVVGHRFNFRATPMPHWNGVTDCQVLIVEPRKRLAYSWHSSGEEAADGLKTVVTWTLRPRTAARTFAKSSRASGPKTRPDTRARATAGRGSPTAWNGWPQDWADTKLGAHIPPSRSAIAVMSVVRRPGRTSSARLPDWRSRLESGLQILMLVGGCHAVDLGRGKTQPGRLAPPRRHGLTELGRNGPRRLVVELQRRRGELLDLLDAIAAAPNADDATRRRTDVLRARLYAVRAGEAALAGLRRAREQRAGDLARLEDELSLRRRPDLPRAEPDTGLGQVSAALEDTTRRLREMTALEALPPATDPATRARKGASLEALTGRDHQTGCAKCHHIDKGTFGEPVLAAEPVLTLAHFTHALHLRAAFPSDWAGRLAAKPLPAAEGQAPPARSPSLPRCAYCHGDMERSELSTELHVQPIADCRACHAPGLQRQDCQLCHLYHPPALRRP